MNNTIIGAALTAAGGILGWLAYQEYHSFSSSMNKMFSSGPNNQFWYYTAGAVVCLGAGLALLSGKAKVIR